VQMQPCKRIGRSLQFEAVETRESQPSILLAVVHDELHLDGV